MSAFEKYKQAMAVVQEQVGQIETELNSIKGDIELQHEMIKALKADMDNIARQLALLPRILQSPEIRHEHQ